VQILSDIGPFLALSESTVSVKTGYYFYHIYSFLNVNLPASVK
jgi:hypothetical protein